MATIDELLLPFAQAIHAKALALRSLAGTITRQQRARLLASIADDIKQCSNFVAPSVSRAAFDEASKINVDLRSKNWHDQDKFDQGRKMFHWEHVVPVKSIRDACETAGSVEAVFKILKTTIRVAWVLKSEDSELTKLGFSYKRPDPTAAYLAAKIELLDGP